MKPRLRSSLLLLVTLGIGMLLGALIQSQLRDKRIKRFHFMRNEASFVQGIEEAIGPLPPAQVEAVHAVLETTAPRIIASICGSREFVRNELETMKAELAEHLDPEQQQRLAARLSGKRVQRKPHDKEETKEP